MNTILLGESYYNLDNIRKISIDKLQVRIEFWNGDYELARINEDQYINLKNKLDDC